MGIDKHSHVVHLIDFGLSKEFRDPDTHRHIPCKASLGVMGTATFASLYNHIGLELGRRDDLESLAYILIYFLRGRLPWQDLESDDLVVECKQTTPTQDLCQGLPMEFRIFLEYSRSLPFDGKPDYNYLYGLFDGLLSKEFQNDLMFDWNVPACQIKERPGSTPLKPFHELKRHESPHRHMG
jgi:serine/threonine protein kinase